jgi:hypothetical protein
MGLGTFVLGGRLPVTGGHGALCKETPGRCASTEASRPIELDGHDRPQAYDILQHIPPRRGPVL